MKFSKKTAHRLLIFLGMFAPIAYLFGTMIGALVGFKDMFPFSADYEVVTSSRVVDFNQKVNITSPTSSPGWETEILSPTTLLINGTNIDTNLWLMGGYSNTKPLFYVEEGHKYLSRSCVLWNYHTSIINFGNYGSSWNIVLCTGDSPVTAVRIGYTSTSTWDNVEYSWQIYDLTKAYGYGNEPTIEEFFTDFPDNPYNPTDSMQVVFYQKSVPDNSQFLFNQFFPRDNFLQRIGENALSETPVGFAPFSAMFRYLDSSVFHGSNSQIALMLYGEIYWALHVVMADLIYHVLVWIPNLVNRVFDWFDSKGLSDE